jgi:hypothetical protein
MANNIENLDEHVFICHWFGFAVEKTTVEKRFKIHNNDMATLTFVHAEAAECKLEYVRAVAV